jgi:signal transduction histidine kinase
MVIVDHLTTLRRVRGWSARPGAVTLPSVPDDTPRKRAAYDAIEDPAKLRRVLEATLLLEANLNLGDLLTHIVEEARSLSNARYGALGVLNEQGTATVDFLASGLPTDVEAHLLQGPLPTGKGVLGVLIKDPRPMRIAILGDHPASTGFPPGHPPMTSFLGAPIRVQDRVYGNLYLTDKVGADEFASDDEAVIEALALAAGIAVENARLHQRAGEIAVYEERDRMARDLHDGVIQRLFAIGLSLQGLSVSPAGKPVADNLSTAVADIDETIRQVRATIFELGGAGGGRGVRSHLVALAEELHPVVGFDVPVEFHGPVDTAVSNAVAEQLLPTVREALTNIGRHAHATRARIRLSVIGHQCRLEITDNGRGFVDGPSADGGLGLPNMRQRAEGLGGSFDITHPESGGTTIAWQVPAFPGRAPRSAG